MGWVSGGQYCSPDCASRWPPSKMGRERKIEELGGPFPLPGWIQGRLHDHQACAHRGHVQLHSSAGTHWLLVAKLEGSIASKPLFHFMGCYFYYQVFSEVDLEPILRRFNIVTSAELGPAPTRPTGGTRGRGSNYNLYHQHYNRQQKFFWTCAHCTLHISDHH